MDNKVNEELSAVDNSGEVKTRFWSNILIIGMSPEFLTNHQ